MRRFLMILALLLLCLCLFCACEDAGDGAEEHVHEWSEWGTVKEASCAGEGKQVRTCSGCHEVEEKKIDKIDVHKYVKGVCEYCKGNTTYSREANYIYFGEYPQTIKENNVTITTTADARGYYLGSDGAYYAMVVASPYGNGYKFSTNSYVASGTIYYFKVEPIRWRILSENNDTALIFCDSIITSKTFDSINNDYADSDIRAWLNDQFYNTAFSALQKEMIVKSMVDNSAASTSDTSNPNACENTEDYIFLLSYAESKNSDYGFNGNESRQLKTSDYSRAVGGVMSVDASYYGNGCWWLRSPHEYYRGCAYARDYDGEGDANYGHSQVRDTYYGIAPALQIRLSETGNP